MILNIKNISRHFGGINAVNNFSVQIPKQSIVGLIGPNGAGKTTLFNILNGFLKPDNGSVLFKGSEILGKTSYQISHLGITRTFQDIRLIGSLTVLDNMLLAFKNNCGESFIGLFNRKKVKTSENILKNNALSLLKKVGLDDYTYDIASNLSYGQSKLLSLSICLATEGDLYLLDEPISGINSILMDKTIHIIKDLANKGKTILIIEHNIDVIKSICDHILFMNFGEIICEGKPEEVCQNPQVIDAYLS